MVSTAKLIKISLLLEDRMTKEMNQAANSLKSFGDMATNVGTKMSVALTAPIVATGIAAAGMAMDFQAAMKNLQSISGQTDAELAAVSDRLLAMSMDLEKTTDSAMGLATALYDIESSGYAGEEGMRLLEIATKAATAGLTDTKTAANSIITVLQSYSLGVEEAERVSDMLFQTVKVGNGSFPQLAASMSNVTGVANALGIEFAEVLAAMSAMSKQGFTFEQASNAIRQSMTSLISPTAEGQKMIEAMGYASGEAMIEALGFAGALQKVAEHTGGSVTEMNKLFSDVDGLKAALALTGAGAQTFAQDLEAITNSAGATQRAFEIQTQSWQAIWQNFQNTVGVALIDIGNTIMEAVAPILQAITPLIKAFIDLPDPVKVVIVALLALVAAIGPLLIIVGQMATGWAAIATVLPVIATTLPAIAAGFMAILAPLMPLIVALGLFYLAYQTNFLGIRDITNTVVSFVVDNLQKAGTAFSQLATMISKAWDSMNQQATTALNQLVTMLATAWGKMGSMAYEFGSAIINGLINGIKSKAVDLIDYVFNLSEEMENAIRTALGIRSPSKVMMELGRQTALGFHKGIESMGGMGVDVATPSISSGRGSTLAASGGGHSGGGNVIIHNLNVPPGTSEQQIDHIMKEIGKATKRKSGGLLGNGK